MTLTNLGELAIAYAVILMVASVVAIAMVELGKRTLNLRVRFHQEVLEDWIGLYVPTNDVRRTLTGIEQIVVSGSRAPDELAPWIADGLYDLRTNEFVTLVSMALDTSLSTPLSHGDVFTLASEERAEDANAWRAHLLKPDDMPAAKAEQLLNRLRGQVQRKARVLRSGARSKWKRLNRMAALGVGVVVTFAALVVPVITASDAAVPAMAAQAVVAFALAIPGGALASLLQAALGRLAELRLPVRRSSR